MRDYKYIFLLLIILMFSCTLYSQENVLQKVDKRNQETIKNTKDTTTNDTVVKKKKSGVIPLPYLITDRNIGYGLALGLAYFNENKRSNKEQIPPTVTGIMGAYTQTKTFLVGGFRSQSFSDDKIRYLGGVFYSNINIDFYKLGKIDLGENPFSVNINMWGTMQRAMFRVKETDFFIGVHYMFATSRSKLNLKREFILSSDSISVNAINTKSYFSALGLDFNFDNRDNTISPNKGVNTGLEILYNTELLGASENFAQFDLYFYGYLPLTKWLYSLYKFDYDVFVGDVPFYFEPYLDLRGAPAMRYQGNQTIMAEIQLRVYLAKRFALVGFGGVGKAFDEVAEFNSSEWVYNYGTGLRYQLKKLFKIRIGADFAWCNDDFGWYLVVGSSLN